MGHGFSSYQKATTKNRNKKTENPPLSVCWWKEGRKGNYPFSSVCVCFSVCVLCAQLLSCVQLFTIPMDCNSPGTSVHGDSPRQEYWSGLPCPPPGHFPHPGIEPRSPALQVDSLLTEPPGKLKNTRVGGLSLLQGIFPTQKSNRGLQHCRRSLYQLSYLSTLSYFSRFIATWKLF